MQSAKNFAKNQSPQTAQMFGGIDPFAMLEKFAGGSMGEQECKQECDNMMKTMGMNAGDMGMMMHMMQQQNNSGRNHSNTAAVERSRKTMQKRNNNK